MSEPEPAGSEPFGEALWWDGSARDRRPQEEVDRLSDHVDAFWGDPRPEPEPDPSGTLLEAVWGPQPAPEAGAVPPQPSAGESTEAGGPEQLSLFEVPPGDEDPATPGPA